MPSQGFLSDRLVPLAFHVDYWDYLGWQDRFAQPRFTKRQRRLASLRRSRTIYTPQLILQGQDFRRRNHLGKAVEQINQKPARAQISLKVTPTSDALHLVAKAEVADATLRRDAHVFIALYENHLHSDVKGGENAGRTLHHQFVLRKWIGPMGFNTQTSLRWTQSIPLAADWKIKHVGVVGCVLNKRTDDILQVVALPLND